ncbi:Xylose isomerase domain-containing protein TIM barrel [Pseudopedobacter saltans DSM 12145]|uniref:Xylose isomerase domain-containing protein TIM barrel n=1 Tax=Pseudopedobacter saltans (strain ATCC 51119 / DSM 12145 / JCM 21818 / CCUG 39354 / LMG 10337 / NBRC 100064 / NCIMB 13643) TaxID=762903 RepID=F0SBR7_PSESL|nr:sugar phosphate isomerase/epimerase family protein [Pseudopedobacter saltans]ADY52758.1 Xylose isomerase domain-containing protein TIM barrel [Pseudopedobacter saltans DSM 12145]
METYFKRSAFKRGCYRGLLALILTGASLSTIGQTVFQGNIVKKPSVKISLNAYSFTKPLMDKVRGRGEGMTMFQLMDWAAQHDFDGVDLTGYYFPGYPNLPSDEYINDIKKYAFRLGLDITGTGVRNNFADPDPAKRAADVKHVKEWIDVAVKLGAPVVRIFAGPIPEGYENRRAEIENYMAASMRECAEYGKLRGVLIGVQNHGDFLKTAEQTISLVKKVNSDWFGVIVDSGYFLTEDPYIDIEKTMPYAVNFQLKLSVFGAASKVKIDLPRIMDIMERTNYRGYLPIEILSPAGGNKAKRQATGIAASSEKNSWDPFTVLPAFMKEVKAAQIQKFGK